MKFLQRIKNVLATFREDTPDLSIQSTARGDFISAQYNISPYNPDALLSKKTYSVIEEMRQDDQVRAVMTLKKFARISPGWVIQPASDAKSDVEAAEFCKWSLENLPGTFNKHLFQLMSALDYGFSITEKNWELSKEKGSRYNGKIILNSLKTRDPQYFTFYQDKYGNLEKDGIAQEQVDSGIKRMPADKFILYTYQEEFDNLYGRSDYRSFYREWWIKSVILKFYAMWLERFPFAPTIAWYPPGTSNANIDAIEDVLEHLQTGTIATLPMGITLDQLDVPASASDAYKVALDVMNKGITRGALVPDLLGYTESGSRGSYALGKKHFDVFVWILEDLGSSIGVLITEQLLSQLTGYNYDATAPVFQVISPEEDPEQKAKVLKILLDAGAVDPLEEWVRDYMNVPQKNQPYIRKFQDELVAGTTTPEAFPYRQLTEYEKATQIDFEETKFFWEKWVSDISQEVSDMLASQINQILPKVQEYFVDKDYRSVRNISLDTKKMEKEMENSFAEVYLTSMAMGVSEIEKSLNQSLSFAEFAPTPAERLKKFGGRVPITKTEWMKLVSGFRSKAFTVAGFIERGIIGEIQRITYKAIDENWFVPDLVKAIEASQIQYTGKAWSLPPGTPMKDYHTKLIFRNAIADIYNGARRDLYFDPDLDEYVPALQYSAILDEWTRQTHREMDSRIYLKSDPVWQEWWPPNGHNCLIAGTKITVWSKNRKGPRRKPIEKIECGDLVYTHEANWKPVIELHHHWYSGELVQLKTECGYELTCTPNHKIFTQEGWKEADNIDIDDKLITWTSISAQNQWENNFERRIKQSKWAKDYNLCGKGKIRKPEIYHPCEFCGKTTNKKRFCSKLCAISGGAYSIKGKKNGWWRHGNYQMQYPKEFNEEFKTDIRRRDNTQCQICGEPRGIGLKSVHHIDGNKKNNAPENLITLCMSCHGKVHFKKKWAKELKNMSRKNEQNTQILLNLRINPGIKRIKFEGFVYNLGVADDESYVANGIIVHNCRCTVIPVTANLNYVISPPVPAGLKPDAGFSKGSLI